MPDFVWRAATASGQITEGRITSASAALALKQLRSQGLAPISLDDQALGGALVDSVAAQSENGFAPVKANRILYSIYHFMLYNILIII